MAEMINLSAKGESFPVYQACPGAEPKGGLIIIHEVWGLTDHIKDVAKRFAAEGYQVLAPNLISGSELERQLTPELQKDMFDPKKRSAAQPKLRKIMAPLQSDKFQGQTLAKLKVCFDELWRRSELEQRVGVVGFCFGGTYSFQLALNEPRLKAAAPFYGHANFSSGQLRQIACPILAFYGEADEPLTSDLPELKEKMQNANVNFEAVVYPDSGHAFFNDTNPFTYNEAAASDAWRKTLSFLAACME